MEFIEPLTATENKCLTCGKECKYTFCSDECMFKQMKKEYYVDGETGKDTNPGTVDEPMRTIAGVADEIERDSFIIEGGGPGKAGGRGDSKYLSISEF